MSQVIVLNVKYIFGDMECVIHPVVLINNNEMILVDCGYPGFMPIIEDEFKNMNLDCNKLTKILITHHDYDHMGAASDFKRKYPHIKIVASEIEAPYISGEKKSLRLLQAENIQNTLSEEEKPYGEAFCQILRNVEPVHVDILVRDGDIMDWCGGCEIISTPGHTKGHISLYLKSLSTIITGDAAVLENDQLVIANPQFTLDIESATKSIAKLLNYNKDTYICYHGGVYKK